jgi:hypothetical protein
MPHVRFNHEPHRDDFLHVREGDALVPCHVRSVDPEAGTVMLFRLRPIIDAKGATHSDIEATYTVEDDYDHSEW